MHAMRDAERLRLFRIRAARQKPGHCDLHVLGQMLERLQHRAEVLARRAQIADEQQQERVRR